MGIAERRERQKAELRELILSAARTIVLTDGFAELSMRKIADMIEYSPATIYLHFASRDDIALQLVREGFVDLLRYLEPAAAIDDPLERLRTIGRRYIAFGLERPESYRLVFMEDPKFSSEVIGPNLVGPDDLGKRAFDLLEATVRELVERGTFRTADPHQAAEVLWAGVHGVVSLQLSCAGNAGAYFFQDVDAVTELLLETLARGLGA